MRRTSARVDDARIRDIGKHWRKWFAFLNWAKTNRKGHEGVLRRCETTRRLENFPVPIEAVLMKSLVPGETVAGFFHSGKVYRRTNMDSKRQPLGSFPTSSLAQSRELSREDFASPYDRHRSDHRLQPKFVGTIRYQGASRSIHL